MRKYTRIILRNLLFLFAIFFSQAFADNPNRLTGGPTGGQGTIAPGATLAIAYTLTNTEPATEEDDSLIPTALPSGVSISLNGGTCFPQGTTGWPSTTFTLPGNSSCTLNFLVTGAVPAMQIGVQNPSGPNTLPLTITVNPNEKPNKITLSPAANIKDARIVGKFLTLPLSQTQTFTAMAIYPDTSYRVTPDTWNTSNQNVVTISSTGVATPQSSGIASISATFSGVQSKGVQLVTGHGPILSLNLQGPQSILSNDQSQKMTTTGVFYDNTVSQPISNIVWTMSPANLVSIDPTGLIKPTLGNVGSTNVTATYQTGFSQLVNQPTSKPFALSVTHGNISSINVLPAAASILGSATQQFSVNGIYQDTTSTPLSTYLSWVSDNPGIATINASGLATPVQPPVIGTTHITATYTPPNGSAIQSQPVPLSVGHGAVTAINLLPASANILGIATQQFAVNATYQDGSISPLTSNLFWVSDNLGIATINASGLATPVKPPVAGSTNITATYAPAGVTPVVSPKAPLNVSHGSVQSFTISSLASKIFPEGTVQFTATGTYQDGTTANLTNQVTWSSSNTTVANISATGLATAGNTLGSTQITASYLALPIQRLNLVVGQGKITSIVLTPSSATILSGKTQQYTATGTHEDGTTSNVTSAVTWASSNPSVATISNTALTQGLATGTTQTGTAQISATYKQVSIAPVNLTVTHGNIASISILPATLQSINPGATLQFTAAGTYQDGSPTAALTNLVTWNSSNPNIATISNTSPTQGLVTASMNNAGTTQISANYQSLQSPNTGLAVGHGNITKVVLSTPTLKIFPLGTTQFTATGTYQDGTSTNLTNQVSWTSSNPAVATINASGLATATSTTGTTQIGVSYLSLPIQPLTLTVGQGKITQIVLSSSSSTVKAGGTVAFHAIGTHEDGTTSDMTSTVNWASSNPNVASISNTAPTQGVATGGTQAGTTQIGASYKQVQGIQPVGLQNIGGLARINVTAPSNTLMVGQTQTYTAQGYYADGTPYPPLTGINWAVINQNPAGVATIDPTGLVTAQAAGSATITATVNGVIGTSPQLTVTQGNISAVSISANTLKLPPKGTAQFTATGTYQDGQKANITDWVTWLSSNASIATISNTKPTQGLATAGSTTGTTQISASYLGLPIQPLTLEVGHGKITSITLTPTAATIIGGGTQQFHATGTHGDGTTSDVTSEVTWTSSNTSIATISNTTPTNGLATGTQQAGSTQIGATYKEVSSINPVTLTNRGVVLQSISIGPDVVFNQNVPQELALAQLSATGHYSDGTHQDITNLVAWTSSVMKVGKFWGPPNPDGELTFCDPNDPKYYALGSTNITASLSGITSPARTFTTVAGTIYPHCMEGVSAKLKSNAKASIAAKLAKPQARKLVQQKTQEKKLA